MFKIRAVFISSRRQPVCKKVMKHCCRNSNCSRNWRQICLRLQQIFYLLLYTQRAGFRDVYKELDAALKGGRKLRGEVGAKSWILN